jgi:4-alpha-glucanotransferase
LKELSRASGILLHPSSLPGPFGIGDLGPEAYRFVDFLEDTGQSFWQVLPVGPTGYGNSPYMCFSAFAGNPYLISPEKLAEEGLVGWNEIGNPPAFPGHRVDYEKAIRYKMALLRKSFSGFERKWKSKYPRDFFAFSEENSFWLDDYAFFMALKERHGGGQWTDWAEPLSRRDAGTLVRGRNELSEEIQFRRFVQYQFFKQWKSLLDYCHGRGVRVIGDIPVYVAQDSAEVWAHRELFLLDDRGRPLVVAGVPPDYFSAHLPLEPHGRTWVSLVDQQVPLQFFSF